MSSLCKNSRIVSKNLGQLPNRCSFRPELEEYLTGTVHGQRAGGSKLLPEQLFATQMSDDSGYTDLLQKADYDDGCYSH